VGRELTRAALLVAARVVAVAACVLVLAGEACKRSGPDWRIIQLYANERTLDLLAHPASVRAFPLDPVRREGTPGDVHAGPFAAAGDAREVPADAAAELSRVLTDAASYDWQRGPKGSGFRPRLGLWFVRGSYVLELAVDLDSAQVGVYAGGQTLGLQSIDPAAAGLAEIAGRVLPPR
jgi:hypothetical protein